MTQNRVGLESYVWVSKLRCVSKIDRESRLEVPVHPSNSHGYCIEKIYVMLSNLLTFVTVVVFDIAT